jgi:hypothetical protein
MSAETLGDAFAAGWRITARCAWGKREGMKSRRECQYTRELDLETLVWTRGPNFPLSSLEGSPRFANRRLIFLVRLRYFSHGRSQAVRVRLPVASLKVMFQPRRNCPGRC